MSIEAIDEQLLRAIGVAIAIARPSDLSVVYRNTVFTDWFGDIGDRSLVDVIPDLTTEDIERVTHDGERFAGELQIKRKRRTLAIAISLSFARTGEANMIAGEGQNVTEMRELESMIDSYSNMVERNTRELEREKETG